MAATLDKGKANGVDDDRSACIVGVMIVAHSIDANQITLVLYGPCPRQQLPGRLARLGPVGYTDDGIILSPVSIAAPAGKAQVVAGQQQQSETAVRHDAMLLPGGIIAVLVAIAEEVVLVVEVEIPAASVGKIMAIAESAVGQPHRQTAADGTLPLAGRLLHPAQGSIVVSVTGYTLRLSGKTRAPHFGQHIKVAALTTVHQPPGFKYILVGPGPADIGLQECYFQYSSNLVVVSPLNEMVCSIK